MKQFLEWWVLFLVQLAGLALCQYFNLFEYVWHGDATKISFVIIAIWLYTSINAGRLAWLYSKGKMHGTDVHAKSENGWFLSDQCLTLGMLGTVIGFLLMMSSINLNAASDPGSIQAMLKAMALGMSTALITTAVGMVFGNLIKLQYFVLGREIQT